MEQPVCHSLIYREVANHSLISRPPTVSKNFSKFMPLYAILSGFEFGDTPGGGTNDRHVISRLMSIGFATWSFIPMLLALPISETNALAVSVIIGMGWFSIRSQRHRFVSLGFRSLNFATRFFSICACSESSSPAAAFSSAAAEFA